MGRYLDEPSDGQLTDFEERIRSLSSAELAILRLLATGLTSAEAANSLGLSRRTVENRRLVLLQKLGVRNLVEAVVYIASDERRAMASQRPFRGMTFESDGGSAETLPAATWEASERPVRTTQEPLAGEPERD